MADLEDPIANQPSHRPTLDDILELPGLSDPQISPDGACVAYLARNTDWEQDDFITQIWVVSVDGATPRQLTFGTNKANEDASSWAPSGVPDGQWLAFLSKRAGDEQAQIYRMSPFGGEAERLTKTETAVQSLTW